MIRLAIVDDHSIVRAGFREMLANELGISVELEAASGEEALKLLREKPCDVLLLDLSLPGQSGIDVLRTVRQHYEQMKVLVLSGFPEERYALPMMRNGANGYLCKDREREELLKAIRTVAQGRRYISGKTAELLAGSLVGETEAAPHESLSERELQVFLRLAKGETVSTIADVLNLSVKTVSTYRSRLLEKLEVSSNAELATYAYHNGLVVD